MQLLHLLIVIINVFDNIYLRMSSKTMDVVLFRVSFTVPWFGNEGIKKQLRKWTSYPPPAFC